MKVTEKDLERLFGTSDLEVLARIAQQVEAGRNNPRGAGRKRRFSLQDVVNMKALQKAGVTQAAIAKQYGTSRQTVSAGFRRLQDFTDHPAADMRIFYMHGNQLCSIINVDHRREKIDVQNVTEKPLLTAFGVKKEPLWEDYQRFLRERCFPESRAHSRQILRDMDLSFFDAENIIEKTLGKVAGDQHWMLTVHNRKAGEQHA